MTAIAYRVYDLPWTPSPADERRVRRVLGAALGIFIGLGIVIPLLPERERAHVAPPAVPDRVVEFLLERPKPPKPEPKVEVPQPKPEIVPMVERPRPVPVPVADDDTEAGSAQESSGERPAGAVGPAGRVARSRRRPTPRRRRRSTRARVKRHGWTAHC